MNETIPTKVICKICGFEGLSLITHLRHIHKLKGEEYKLQYNVTTPLAIVSKEVRDKLSKINKEYQNRPEVKMRSSESQKNGASYFTTKFWMNRGMSESQAKEKVSEIQKENSKKSILKGCPKEKQILCNEYWTSKGYSTAEATEIIRNRQVKASALSSRFTGCIRTEESKKQISNSMKKKIEEVGRGHWASHFGNFTGGRSKSEINFYNYIKGNVDSLIEANVHIPNTRYIADIVKGNNIIEFYGDYWHGNPEIFDETKLMNSDINGKSSIPKIWERDKLRTIKLNELGYKVLIIWEYDWNNNKEECIEKIKKFLL